MSQLEISTIGLNSVQQTIAEAARKAVKIEGSKVSFDSGLYEQTLPEGITADMVKRVQKHNSDFVVATRAVGGESAIAVMAKDKTVLKVTSNIKCFNDTVSHVHNRSKVVRNPTNGAEKTVYGSGTSKVTVGGTKNSAAQMKGVVTALGNLGAQLLNN